MAVITADGIVGKVLEAYRSPSTSKVLLINDQTSGVGAILDKTRLQGILRGTASGEVVLEKVMSDENVPAGELVLTSGGDGIFPKGLLVGRVTKVGTGSDLFLNIRVRPAADLSRLEEVLVVTKIDERQALPEQTGAARAVDILAARLPGVPSKPENAVKGDAAVPASAGSGAKPKAVSTPASAARRDGCAKNGDVFAGHCPRSLLRNRHRCDESSSQAGEGRGRTQTATCGRGQSALTWPLPTHRESRLKFTGSVFRRRF